MATFALPIWTQMMQKLDVPLPMLTKVMIGFAMAIRNNWYFMIGGAVALVVGFRVIVRKPAGRYAWDKVKLGLPVFGKLIGMVAVSRFARAFGLLFSSGVEVKQCLTIGEKVVGNAVMAAEIAKARERVMGGESISSALGASGYFPPMVLRMIRIGETTGSMAQTMERVNQFYEREVPAAVDRVLSLTKPLVLLFLAVVIVLIALSMYLPMYEIFKKIGQVRR
jgi:type IV pilus assembly protein PilC